MGEKKVTTHGVRLLDKRGGENTSTGTGQKQSSGWYDCLVFQDDSLVASVILTLGSEVSAGTPWEEARRAWKGWKRHCWEVRRREDGGE